MEEKYVDRLIVVTTLDERKEIFQSIHEDYENGLIVAERIHTLLIFRGVKDVDIVSDCKCHLNSSTSHFEAGKTGDKNVIDKIIHHWQVPWLEDGDEVKQYELKWLFINGQGCSISGSPILLFDTSGRL